MQVISLFSGIGGFELAAEWMGWLNIASCEINPFGQKVLKHYWPNAYHHDDIKTMNYDEIRDRINPQIPTVVVGGFPCQPYSTAGKRLGKDDERHLWPYCVRTVQQIRPNYCVFENVRGLTNWNGGMVFDEVQSDLEAEGYEVLPFLLPACAVNAPHRRDRIWFIAYSNYKGGGDGSSEVPNKNGEVSQWHNDAESGNADQRSVADTDSGRDTRHRDESRIATSAEQGREDNEGIFLNNGGELNAANSVSIGQQGQRGDAQSGNTKAGGNGQTDWSNYDNERWERFPTQPPVRWRNDGVSPELVGITVSKHRQESIKGYGNAIVPQVALQIFKAIQEYERINTI